MFIKLNAKKLVDATAYRVLIIYRKIYLGATKR